MPTTTLGAATTGLGIPAALALLIPMEAVIVRRGRRVGAEAWTEAACPACLVLGALGDRESRREEAKLAAPA
jgi:hypothetical protein